MIVSFIQKEELLEKRMQQNLKNIFKAAAAAANYCFKHFWQNWQNKKVDFHKQKHNQCFSTTTTGIETNQSLPVSKLRPPSLGHWRGVITGVESNIRPSNSWDGREPLDLDGDPHCFHDSTCADSFISRAWQQDCLIHFLWFPTSPPGQDWLCICRTILARWNPDMTSIAAGFLRTIRRWV